MVERARIDRIAAKRKCGAPLSWRTFMRLVSPTTANSSHHAANSPSSLARAAFRLSLSRATNGSSCMFRVCHKRWWLLYVRACVFRQCARACIHRVPFTVSQCIRASDTIIVVSAFERSNTATVTSKHDSDAGVLPHTVGKTSFHCFSPDY